MGNNQFNPYGDGYSRQSVGQSYANGGQSSAGRGQGVQYRGNYAGSDACQNGGYQGDGYQDGAYPQNGSYQNGAYQNAGYQNDAYQNAAYPNGYNPQNGAYYPGYQQTEYIPQTYDPSNTYPQQSEQDMEEPKKKGGCLGTVVRYVLFIAFVLAIGLAIRAFVIEPYIIPSSSMEETLMVGDRLFAEKVSYHVRNIQAGDIVIFDDPDQAGRTLIKRCIATEGQTININDSDGKVYVDGVALDESYTLGKPSYQLSGGVTFPYTVPSGCIWVMGDNRTNSKDSRYFGAIEISTVKARACLIFWPFNRISAL